jgi:hypothetical protein
MPIIEFISTSSLQLTEFVLWVTPPFKQILDLSRVSRSLVRSSQTILVGSYLPTNSSIHNISHKLCIRFNKCYSFWEKELLNFFRKSNRPVIKYSVEGAVSSEPSA